MRRRRAPGPVTRIGEDVFSINLEPEERRALSSLMDQLSAVALASPDDDPRIVRLFPTAYHQDSELDAEYQSYMRAELQSARNASILIAKEALDTATPLTESQVHAFMTVLNGLRLVLGTMLDVQEDSEPSVEEGGAGTEQLQLYAYLGWLLEWTVEALAEP